MLNTKTQSIEAIKIIARALGDLNDQVIYVGGAVAALYADDPGAQEIRPTKDVDIVLKIASVLELEIIRQKLAERGIHFAKDEGVMCRFIYQNILLHMSNPNSTILSGILIAIFGYLRIFGWLRSGQLWLSMGMHAWWDFFQGPILGFTVSGMNTESLIKQTISGEDWITGGSFGPEAGIVVIPVIIFGLIIMYLWTSKRENIPWKK